MSCLTRKEWYSYSGLTAAGIDEVHAQPMTALPNGFKMMLGKDPKKEYKDKVAEVELTN